MFINSLLKEITPVFTLVNIGAGRKLSVLAYADDIVLMSASAEGLQCMLDVVRYWCACKVENFYQY